MDSYFSYSPLMWPIIKKVEGAIRKLSSRAAGIMVAVEPDRRSMMIGIFPQGVS